MQKIDKKYIENHLETIHTYESFGRSVCENILHASLKRVKGNDKDNVQMTANISVRATERICLQVCKVIDGSHVTVHIYTNPQ
ncbi:MULTISPECIES: hypothetical protein [unclassified Bacillus (in: firmicutes)]|uniref:hypothetical protein n=1 Tax=unclassified Bacillus (in: firmicutes) TaxID=185979 RepID=UPI0030103037